MKKILFVGSEVMPYAATGGLGDVLGSLPEAIKKCDDNFDVRVMMPLYGVIEEKYRREMKFIKSISVSLAWRNLYCGIFELRKNGVVYYFLDNEYYFKRAGLYGDFDDGEKFAFFCAAVLKVMPHINFFPDILHANDWQSALSIIYLNMKYKQIEEYKNIRTIFTIHNIQYQGQYDFAILGDVFDLGPDAREYVDYNGCINLMKGAVILCDYISTVSPQYAKEITQAEHSHDLHHILGPCHEKIHGILNGIDYDYYDPSKDEDLYVNYTWRSPGKKGANKEKLQEYLHLPVRKDVPLMSVISRLVSHKGIDLIKNVLEDIIANSDVQFIVLGTGDMDYENYFRYLQGKYDSKVRAIIAYDRALSKKIYASSDIFIMPSKSEPCGLSQMIASRYGAVPVVRETGGLYDSIKGYYEDSEGVLHGNGFTFRNYYAYELKDRIYAALGLYKDREKWEKFVKTVMRKDFSWDMSAKKYIEMYNDLVI